MNKILALHVGHDATAMFINEKEFIAISEERVSRIKNYYGFPLQAIKKIFKEKKIKWSNIEKIIITSQSLKNSKSFKNFFFFNFISEDFSNKVSLFARLIFILNLFFINKTFHQLLKEFLKKYNFKGKIQYLDHHLCHIASSLATYPIDNSMLLSLDGGGDNVNWSLYSYSNRELRLLENSRSFYKNKRFSVHDTPADIYSNTTKFLGFKRLRDEGKVMGLSGGGKPRYYKYFSSLLKFEDGRFISKFGPQSRGLKDKLIFFFRFIFQGINYDRLQIDDMKIHLKNYSSKEDVSASLQKFTEKLVNKLLDYLSKKYNFNNQNLLLSGGFFSNVCANKRIKERKDINNVFVVPNMGDGGLVLGGIYLALSKHQKKKFFANIQGNAFFGNKAKNINTIPPHLKVLKLSQKKKCDYIVNGLINNKIIGVINEKMEFGPRALGNRSILANPAQKNITNKLNKRLKRSDFMPFAPMIRDIDAKKILKNYSKTDYSSKFMTITYEVKKEFKLKLRNIVHLDNTIRVQVIDRINNKLCYDILTEFNKKTKLPCLINTSFNVHEEPIVMNIEDGIKALNNNVVDMIVNENEIIIQNE